MFLQNLSLAGAPTVMISLAIILLVAFLLTRITKKLNLPNVTAYIFTGILIGPSVLGLIPTSVTEGMSFITDTALAFIAFGVGKFFKLSALRGTGKQVVVLTLFESLTAAALITLCMYYLFRLPLGFSLLLGAIASATAPASTLMTIRQYNAKGKFVDLLLQVVALDDAVALVAFSVCVAIAGAVSGEATGNIGFDILVLPILLNIIALAIGALCGWVLSKIINEKRTADNKLMLTIAIILLMAGLCSAADVSPLLSCMMLGAVYINLSDNIALFEQVEGFTPPILTMFFVLSGMRLDLSSLKTAGIIGIVYFAVRIAGKYLGSYIGAAVSGCTPQVRKYLGLALIPQAGVSIGLAALGERILEGEMGTMLSTIILSSAVLYEMVGPAAAKLSLRLAGIIPKGPPPVKKAYEELEYPTVEPVFTQEETVSASTRHL